MMSYLSSTYCYSIYHFCWYNISNSYNFITRDHWSLSNTFQILTILTSPCVRISNIIFFAYAIIFTFPLTCFIIQFLIWITCCTIEFAFTMTWNMFCHCLNFILFYYHIEYSNIYAFFFNSEHMFLEIRHYNFLYIYLTNNEWIIFTLNRIQFKKSRSNHAWFIL